MRETKDSLTEAPDADLLIQGYSSYLLGLQVSEHTARNYVYDARRWAAWFKRPVEFFGQDEWDDWTQHLLREGVSGRSVRRYQSSIRKFFKYLRRRKLVSHDPSYDAESVKIHKRVVGFLTEEETRAFFSVEQPLLWRTLCLVIYSNGLRNSEARNLKLSDIIGDSLKVYKGKGKKDRLLPLMLRTKLDLEYWLSRHPGGVLLFPSETGGVILAQRLRRHIKSTGRRAGLNRLIKPHMLRHSIATHVLNRGMDLRFIQELLGHEDIESTTIYTHVAQQELEQAVQNHHPFGGEATGPKESLIARGLRKLAEKIREARRSAALL